MNVQLVVTVEPKKTRMMHLLADLEVTAVAAVSVEVVLRLTAGKIVGKNMGQVAVRLIVLAKRMRKRMTTRNILLKQRVQILWFENFTLLDAIT